MLMTKMKRCLIESLMGRGVFLGRTTDSERLNRFFKTIVPYDTDKRLVRVGGNGDGGYLVPDDLVGLQACFSPGVAATANFELELAERSIPCFMADYSVNKPPLIHPLFDFEKKYLGTVNDEVFTTLPGWMERKAADKSDLLLQMDIEGAEYGVILDTPESYLKKFRIIVLEFHNLHRLFSSSGFDLIDMTFSKLLRNFEIVHIHPNNCTPAISVGDYSIPSVMEFTFLRKDRIAAKKVARFFPHPLDIKNMNQFEDIVLPECWRGVGHDV